MSQHKQGLHATVYDNEVGFPAFVHLPASARPQTQHLLSDNNGESIKCLYLYGRMVSLELDDHPFDTPYEADTSSFRKQMAPRLGIPENAIQALSVDLQGSRVLIESDDDWDDWVYAYFFRPSLLHAGGSNAETRKDFVIEPVHIHVIVNGPEEQQAVATSTTTSESALAGEAPPSDRPSSQDRASAQESGRQHSQSTQNMPLREASSHTAQPTTPDPVAALVNNAVGSVLQALQPQLQGLPHAIVSSLSAANAHRANAQRTTFPAASASQTSNAAASSTAPATSGPAVSTSGQSNASQQAASVAQRQSLISGFVDELTRARSQPAAAEQAGENRSATEGEMSNELGQAFAEMLARQRSNAAAATPAAASSTVVTGMEDDENDGDESLTIVSTPSSSSRRSSRSRSRSRSRTARTTTFLSSTTLLLLTLITFICTLIAPTTASVITSLNPPPTVLHARNSLVQTRHLCKCTCFQTNSTLVPLYSPADPAKPCLTCTRQFCLDQGLEICKGAKLEHTDHDVGTGLEGDVWAKCFERDSYKDQSIITLYILVVVGLVGFASLRGRMQGWVDEYARLGPRGVLDVVRGAPWMRGR